MTSAPSGESIRHGRGRRWFTGARVAAVLAFCLIVGSTGAVWRLHPAWLERWMQDGGGKESTSVATAQPAAPRTSPAALVSAPPKAATVPAPPSPATSVQSPAASGDAIELALWQSTTAQGTESAYEEYLRQYPSGHFSEAAKAQIETLKRAQQRDTAALAPAHIPDLSAQLTQGIPFDCPKPGTVIAFSDGRRLTFGERAGFRCKASAANGKEADEYAGFTSLSTLPSLATEDLEKFWPLREHAELSFSTRTPEFFSGQIQQAWVSNRYRVVGTEHLHLPAGDFETVIVERRFLSRAAAIFESVDVTQRIWYAPKIAHVLKVVSQRGNSVYMPAALPGHVEATEVTVP